MANDLHDGDAMLQPEGAIPAGAADHETRSTPLALRGGEHVVDGSATDGEGKRALGVFGSLVRSDDDITGLVAYAIYKRNKLDWLQAFETSKGHAPSETELASYLCGEQTPRRLSTYRFLADATLAGRGPHAGQASTLGETWAPPTGEREHRAASASRAGPSAGQIVAYAIIAVIFVVGVVLAWRFTSTPMR